MKKQRIDLLLTERGLAPSRQRARAMVMSGNVLANEQKILKPGTEVLSDAVIRILGKDCPYVSRGGLKLKKALDFFGLDVKGKTVLDAGASTGGFTDCLLQHGAEFVYAVDVGYGQLAWSLRSDPRVRTMERMNIRDLTPEALDGPVDLAVIDVSFISLKLVLPPVRELLKDEGLVVCLIKPQFEAGRELVEKKGVVRDPKTHELVLNSFFEFAHKSGFYLLSATYSPVKGPEGNIEFLGLLSLRPGAESIDFSRLVAEAHAELAAEKK